MNYLYTAIISYLLGSINPAYLYSKSKGFDIRERGSNNAGASNMKVNFGWWAGIVTCLLDFSKAIIAISLSRYLFPNDEIIPFFSGAMTIVGHIFPFYMGFKGGKGFACYIGMLLAINWKLGLAIMALTGVVSIITNYIVMGTFATITVTPLYYIYIKANIYIILILVAIAALMFYKHRVNIKRLIRHEEMGIFDRKKKKEEEKSTE